VARKRNEEVQLGHGAVHRLVLKASWSWRGRYLSGGPMLYWVVFVLEDGGDPVPRGVLVVVQKQEARRGCISVLRSVLCSP
jgi:hypothetical protein